MKNEAFESTVWQLARKHGVPLAEVRFSPKAESASATSRAGGRITYGKDLATQSPEFVRWSAAHELAHVALGHGVLRAHQRTLTLSAIALVVGIALLTPAVMHGGEGHWFLIGAIGYTAIVVASLTTILGITHRKRRFERAADALALSWGYRVTPAIASELEVLEWHARWLPEWARDHPRPSDRIRPQR